MRTKLTLVATVLAVVTGCTVKNFEAPELSGPSAFAKDFYLTATPDVLTQNGVDQAQVRVSVKSPSGAPVAGLTLKAEIRVNDVVQDFGSLSSKTRATDSDGSAVFIYTAPPAPSSGAASTGQTVQVAVTPIGADAGTELARIVDIKLIPQGVIGPSNPSLTAAFTVTPVSPQAFTTAAFDASTTTNNGQPCGAACTYFWDFGDGTTGTGLKTTHDYRTGGSKTIRLTVTDSIGAQATAVQTITVTPSTPPTALFTVSPTGSLAIDQDAFFSAAGSRPATGRTITGYTWDFGDRETGSGVTISHHYRATGTFNVVLTVTDDAGSQTQSSPTAMTVVSGNPVAALVVQPSSPKSGERAVLDASTSIPSSGATIVSYTFEFGDASDPVTTTSPTTAHTWAAARAQGYAVSVTIRDSYGRSSVKVITVVVQ